MGKQCHMCQGFGMTMKKTMHLLWKACNNRVMSQTVRSNQQQTSQRSTIQEGQWHNYCWRSFTSHKFQFYFTDVNLFEFLAVSEQTRDKLISAIKEDKNLQKLIKLIKQGFPMRYKALEPQLKHLYKFRGYLSTKDDLVFYKDRVFVPTSMRDDMKKKAHTSNLAIDSYMRYALDTIFWPGIRHNLQECYMNCKLCSRNFVKNSKEILITRPVPEYPFQCNDLDTITLDGRKYLVCVDYFSNYTMVDWLQGISSGHTIKLIRKHFMRYDIPEEVIWDLNLTTKWWENWAINTDSNGIPVHQRCQTPTEWWNQL